MGCGGNCSGNCSTPEQNESSFDGAFLGLEDMVPDLNLQVYNPVSDEIEDMWMSDYRGHWTVLVFYPADFTFVCPTELKDLHKRKQEFLDLGANVMVVSTDTCFSHKRRVETEKLLAGFSLPMISDRTQELSMLFGVLDPSTGNAMRGTFIISPEGIIKSVEVVSESIGRSAGDLVRKVKALHHVRENPGVACPASWEAGDKIITPSVKIAGHVSEALDA